MRLLRSVIVVIVLAAGLTGPTHAKDAGVSSAAGSPVGALAGKNTVFGSETAWTRVRLPKQLPFSELSLLETKFKGDGRVVGIFLFEEIDGVIHGSSREWWVARYGNCGTRACQRVPGDSTTRGWKLDDNEMIPAGIYRLFLVVDGAPASVTFEIPGLAGSTRINPTQPMGAARAKVQTLKTRLHTSETGIAFAAGNEAPFDGDGIALQHLWIDPIGVGAVGFAWCWYRNQSPPNPATAYLPPQCNADGLGPFTQRHTPFTPCCLGFSGSWPYLPKAMGSWYISTAPVESSGAVALWLKVD